MSFDSATVPAATLSIDSAEIHDLRLEDDDLSASTYLNGATICSSAPSSPPHSLHDGDRANRGMINVQIASSLSLSLNPSMVGSSMLIPAETNGDRNLIELNQVALSQSSVPTSDISVFTASDFTPCYTPDDVYVNIGRSIMLASSASSDTNVSESACDELSMPSGVAESVKGTNWWDRLQTDEDWDDFRTKASDYLNALIIEEMKELKGNEQSSGTGSSVDKTTIMKENSQQNNEGFSKVRQWLGLQFLCSSLQAFFASTLAGVTSNDDSVKTRYFSSLIKEIADVQQQLGRLPPIPPSLPLDDLSLDNLPIGSRDILVQYNIQLDEWKERVVPQQEELSAKYAQCQEKLLAAIIDAEEKLFYDNKDGCNMLGAVNDDGYIEVDEKESIEWGDVNEALLTSPNKCQMTLRAAFVAALTAGAGIIFALQSKRR